MTLLRGRRRRIAVIAGAAMLGALVVLLGWTTHPLPWQEATGWSRIPERLRPADGPAWTPRSPEDAPPEISWLGHSGFVVRWKGATLLLDPNTSARCTATRRILEPAIDVARLGPIDAVILSHAHYDHLDLPTLRRLVAVGHVVLPDGAERYVSGGALDAAAFDGLAEGDCASVASLSICGVRAQHEGNRYHPFASRIRALGYVIRAGGDAIYYAGDTGAAIDFAAIRDRYHPRLAILPIGAWLPRFPMKHYHLSPEEAADAASRLGVETVIPCHFGTFRVSADAPSSALPRFAEAARARARVAHAAAAGGAHAGDRAMIERVFASLARVSVRRPGAVLAIAAIAVALAGFGAARRLELRTSNLDLVSPDLPEVKRFTDFASEFGTPNVLVVVLEIDDASAPDPEAALHAAVHRAGPLVAKVPGVRTVVDELPFDDEVLADAGVERYLLSDDKRMAFMLVQPEDARSNAESIATFVAGTRTALAAAHLGDLGVRAGLTGMPAYALDDREVLQRDITRLSGVAGILELVLLVLVFGSFWRPLLAVGTLMASLVLVMGLASIHPGHLTLLSSFFVSIAFGEGIDFAIHVFSRVQELTAAGLSEREAIPLAVERLARGMATTVLTTSGVFLAMTLSGFRGFAELGVIAAMTLPVCLLTSLTVLPAAIVAARLRPPEPGRSALAPLRRFLARRSHPLLATALAAAALGALLLGGPGFDRDYLNLEPRGSEAVRLERAMVSGSRLSPSFAVFTTGSREAAIDLSDRLLREEVVGEVASIADLDALSSEGAEGRATDDAIAWRRSLESPRGRFAVMAYPQGDIWDPATQARFLERMRALDPEVTGMPFLGSFMVDRSLRALGITAALAVLVVFGCAWLDMRSVPLTLLTAVPAVLTIAALHGAMHAIGLRYNPLDILALPIIVGYAVDDAVHVVHGFLAERSVARALESAGTSIVMTSATTIVSFGALAFTRHRGLASFAIALVLGVALALVMAVVVLPALLQRCPARWMKGAGP